MTEASDENLTELGGSVRAQTARGLVWSVGGQLFRTAGGLGGQILLARLLLPEDFGVVAISAAFVAFATAIFGIAIEPALVRDTHVTPQERWGAQWLALVSGLALGAMLAAAAAPLASAFDDERLLWIIPSMSLVFPLSALGLARRVKLQRSLEFRVLAIVDAVGFALGISAALLLASLVGGPSPLVAQSVVMTAAANVGLWMACKDPAHGVRHLPRALRFLGFGWKMAASAALNYINRYADNLLIGAYLGATELGLYSRAYSLMLFPIYQVAGIVGRVAIPVMTRLQSVTRQADAYLRFVGVIAFVSLPAMAWLTIDGRAVIVLLLGEQWDGTGKVVQLLAPVGAVQSVVTTVGWVYQVRGRAGLLLRWTVFATPVIFLSFVLGIAGGSIESVALAYGGCFVVLTPAAFVVPCRLLGIGFRDLAQALAPAVAVASAVALGGAGIRLLSDADEGLAHVMVSGAVSAALAAGAALTVGRRPLDDIRTAAADVRRHR